MKKQTHPPYARPSPFHVSDADMVHYLDHAQSQGTDDFLEALSEAAKAKGMEHVAEHAGLNRISLYKSLRAGSKPRYETIGKVLDSLGISIQLTLKPQDDDTS